jgi:SAM-dependent methyltransferase
VNNNERLPGFLPSWLKERLEVNVIKLNRFMQLAGQRIPGGALVLDAGAGEGRFKSNFSHTRYMGVDLAVGDIQWDYSDLDTISDLEKLPFTDLTFDAAVCTQVLEHVREPQQVINEIARVLKPGGLFFLSAPQSWHQHQKPHDYYRYTSYGMRYIIEKSGLQVESIQPLGGYFWFLSFQLQNSVYWVFSFRNQKYRWITFPLRALMAIIFQIILPFFLYFLDGLDPVKDETFGHVCIAVKPRGDLPSV